MRETSIRYDALLLPLLFVACRIIITLRYAHGIDDDIAFHTLPPRFAITAAHFHFALLFLIAPRHAFMLPSAMPLTAFYRYAMSLFFAAPRYAPCYVSRCELCSTLTPLPTPPPAADCITMTPFRRHAAACLYDTTTRAVRARLLMLCYVHDIHEC